MPATIDETHDPKLESWIESANNPSTDFPLQNLPWRPGSLNTTARSGRAS